MNLNSIYNEIKSLQAGSPEAMLDKVLDVLAGHGFDEPGAHAHIWSIEDVHAEMDGLYQRITDEQAMQVIEYTFANHDSGVGVNYDVLRERISDLDFDTPLEDEDESEDEEE